MRTASWLFALLALPLLTASQCTVSPAPPQGWSDAERVAWYTASQGSRMVPQAWLDNLEQPDGTGAFLDPAYVASYRYLPNPTAGWTAPGSCAFDRALPLGFAVDCQSDTGLKLTSLRWKTGQSDHEPWVGMNCSACHTAEISYGGQAMRIEGGPTLADFQGFTGALEKALVQTATDDAKFARFSAKVLGAGATDADRAMLKSSMAALNTWNAQLAALNDPGGLQYGFGRLDAIGHIYNKIALVAMREDGRHQIANPADAPVSYPFLWNVPQLDKVEWDGIVPNSTISVGIGNGLDYGALGRNAGEVIGVFADLTVTPQPGLGGYPSSINLPNLAAMEKQLGHLQSPTWPAAFPQPDAGSVAAGGQLFSQRCASCHTVPSSRGNLTEHYTTTLSQAFSNVPHADPVNTDIWMACNAAMDAARTGSFAGNKQNYFSGAPFGAQADNFTMLQNAAVGSLLGKKSDLVASGFADLFAFSNGLPLPSRAQVFAQGLSAKQIRRDRCTQFVNANPQQDKVVYKGRPLQGIWATAPYLHNGSVPTLYDLLLPPAQRPTVFYVGTRVFDPVRVGFVSTPSAENSFKFDTTLDGNSNAGHDYGNASLTEAQRQALLDYMKTL
jgi:cytochrome c peroxidase